MSSCFRFHVFTFHNWISVLYSLNSPATMPRRTDIHTILIIGSGPIVIGQGCEFDYSGVQACRALKEEGYRIVLINSNPATIMTDPEFADATYVEPITPEAVEKILVREAASGHPIDALLPTLGGQTGLNTGMACFDQEHSQTPQRQNDRRPIAKRSSKAKIDRYSKTSC